MESTDTDYQDRIIFYEIWLPHTYVRGLIVAVNLLNRILNLIRVPLGYSYANSGANVFESIQLRPFRNPEEAYNRIMRPHISNLHTLQTLSERQGILEYCDIMSMNGPIEWGSPFTACIPHLLSSKFNYTVTNVHSLSVIFTSNMGVLVNDENLNRYFTQLRKINEWASAGVRSSYIGFQAFQRRLPFPADALTKPYEGRGWLLCFTGALGLVAIPIVYACQNVTSYTQEMMSVVTSTIASILDLAMTGPCQVSGASTKIKARRCLHRFGLCGLLH